MATPALCIRLTTPALETVNLQGIGYSVLFYSVSDPYGCSYSGLLGFRRPTFLNWLLLPVLANSLVLLIGSTGVSFHTTLFKLRVSEGLFTRFVWCVIETGLKKFTEDGKKRYMNIYLNSILAVL